MPTRTVGSHASAGSVALGTTIPAQGTHAKSEEARTTSPSSLGETTAPGVVRVLLLVLVVWMLQVWLLLMLMKHLVLVRLQGLQQGLVLNVLCVQLLVLLVLVLLVARLLLEQQVWSLMVLLVLLVLVLALVRVVEVGAVDGMSSSCGAIPAADHGGVACRLGQGLHSAQRLHAHLWHA
jgi:hypothetical protein